MWSAGRENNLLFGSVYREDILRSHWALWQLRCFVAEEEKSLISRAVIKKTLMFV